MRFSPHEYQAHAIAHVKEKPFCGLFLDMGLGKTVSSMTAVNDLMFDELEINKILVIAPKKVAETVWSAEAQKWDHLKHLRISTVLGTEKQRKEALKAKADIYVINRENVVWLVALYGSAWPFDTVIIDELSSFKSAKAQRFKALRKVRPLMKRVIGLTGTPAPNNLLDLWPEMFLIDRGERLGDKLTTFRETYFRADKQNGMVVYSYKPLPGTEETIYEKIKDVCISMKAGDYLDLPARVDRDNFINFSDKLQEKYNAFERDEILKVGDLKNISVPNAAALTNKLLQFTNGAVYDEDRNVHELHTEKIEALIEDIEAANGNPVLVFYSYKHDLERLGRYLKKYKPVILSKPEDVDKWNRKEISLLFAHPASAGHGLNMQAGGNLLEWFGLTWSSEIYLQAVARLDRQGQTKPVINSRLIVKNTIDEDVLTAITAKIKGQDALMYALKARIEKYVTLVK